MLAIQSSTSYTKTVTPNILPAKIHHNGPIPTSKRYWDPETSQKEGSEAQESYLRGRKLLGKTVKLPEGYEGVVLQKTEKTLPQQQAQGQDEIDEEEEDVEVKVMEQTGKFSEIIVWGHEVVPGEEDVYRQGIEEWVGFAEAMHAYDSPTSDTT